MGFFKKIAKLEQQNVDMALQIVKLKKELEDFRTWRACHDECHSIDHKNMLSSFRRVNEAIRNIEKRVPEYEEAIAKGVDDVWNKAVQSIVDFNPYKNAGGDA